MSAPHSERIDRAILELLAERRPTASICPSEAARRLEPSAWRDLMDDVRGAARVLARNGRIEITRRGDRLDPDGELHGPIRLRLPRTTPSEAGCR